MKNEDKSQEATSKDQGENKEAGSVDPVPVAEVPSDSKKKRSEAGIQIKVRDENQEEKSQEQINTQDAEMQESGYVDSENPYLYDMSGVNKKTINYGEMPLNDDLGDYDIDQQI